LPPNRNHQAFDRRFQDIARETLDWFDKYLGPVTTKAGP
jgi:hypothetical protein